MQAIEIGLVTLICISVFSTFYNSIMSRRSDGISHAIFRSRMNISMGIMFLAIGVLQLLTPGSSLLRLSLIFLIIVLGVINLYYGIKNNLYFHKLAKENEANK